MAGITNDKLFEALTVMAQDIAVIKETIKPLPQMYKDIYIGNGDRPLREVCREYEEERRNKETAVTVALNDKKDNNKWLKRTAWGALITGMISAIIGVAVLYIKLLPALSAIK